MIHQIRINEQSAVFVSVSDVSVNLNLSDDLILMCLCDSVICEPCSLQLYPVVVSVCVFGSPTHARRPHASLSGHRDDDESLAVLMFVPRGAGAPVHWTRALDRGS